MLNRVLQSTLLTSVAIGCAIALPPPSQAQVTVTGGSLNFQGTQIYVPARYGNNAVIYGGSAQVLVNTSVIPSINSNVLLRGQILPQLNTCPCSFPSVGDQGTWSPTLTFVGRSSSGEPTLFVNIPSDLKFTVTGLTPTGPASPINEFSSGPLVLTQTGVAVNASSFGGVQRVTPVRLVEYGQFPSTELVNLGIASVTPGTNYPGDIRANITGGVISTPLTNSISGIGSPTPGSGASNNGSNGSFAFTASTYIGEFNSITSIFSVYGSAIDTTPRNPEGPPPTKPRPDDKPGKPEDKPNDKPGKPDDKPGKPEDKTGKTDDKQDDDTIFIDRKADVRVVVVGLPSRVFPGVIGVEVIRGN